MTAQCIFLRKVTLRRLSRFCPFTGQGRVSGQVARMVPKVSTPTAQNTGDHNHRATFTTQVCVCVDVCVPVSVGARTWAAARSCGGRSMRLASMMDVVLERMQSPVFQLKKHTYAIEPYV